MTTIYLLGPCHKINRKTGCVHPAFDEAARSGRYLRNAVGVANRGNVRIVYSNILSGAWTDASGQEQLPNLASLVRALPEHPLWVDADVVIGLGGLVRQALEGMQSTPRSRQPQLVFLAHPSFILRRPAEERLSFETGLRSAIIGATKKSDPMVRSVAIELTA